MSGRTHVALALAAAGLFMASSAKADVVESLQTLMDQGSLTVGNATYSNFQPLGGNIAAGDILVTITGNAGGNSSITFSAAWATNPTTPTSNGNSQIDFHVQFATPITGVGLSFVATGSAGGLASVGETLINPATSDHTTIPSVLTDGAGSFADVFSVSYALPSSTSALEIQKSIDIAGASPATISSVTNTYTVPEPASLGLFGLGAMALLRRRSRSR